MKIKRHQRSIWRSFSLLGLPARAGNSLWIKSSSWESRILARWRTIHERLLAHSAHSVGVVGTSALVSGTRGVVFAVECCDSPKQWRKRMKEVWKCQSRKGMDGWPFFQYD